MRNPDLAEAKVAKQLKFRTDNFMLLMLKNMGLGNVIYLPLCYPCDTIYCPLISHTQSYLMCGFMRAIILRAGHLKRSV